MSDSGDTPANIDETLVEKTAALAQLRIAPEYLPGVVANLQGIAAVAAIVNATPLAKDDELGPIWKP